MQPWQAVHVMGIDKENDGSLSSLKPAVATGTQPTDTCHVTLH